MKITIDLDQLKAIEGTLAQMPSAPPIEQWGLTFACYNTIKQMRVAAEAEAPIAQEGDGTNEIHPTPNP